MPDRNPTPANRKISIAEGHRTGRLCNGYFKKYAATHGDLTFGIQCNCTPFNFHQLIHTKSHMLIIWGLYRMPAFALNSTYRVGDEGSGGILFRYKMIFKGK